MTQYGMGKLVYRMPRTKSSQRYIHRDPDCETLYKSGADPMDLLEKPLPSFTDDVPRCPECFDDD